MSGSMLVKVRREVVKQSNRVRGESQEHKAHEERREGATQRILTKKRERTCGAKTSKCERCKVKENGTSISENMLTTDIVGRLKVSSSKIKENVVKIHLNSKCKF